MTENKTRLDHIALFSGSRKNTDAFYRDILGLKTLGEKIVPADLSRQIFGKEIEYLLVNYGNESIRFEMFISDKTDIGPMEPLHVCLMIPDRDTFIGKCETGGCEITSIFVNERILYFVRDFDGNLFEIKSEG